MNRPLRKTDFPDQASGISALTRAAIATGFAARFVRNTTQSAIARCMWDDRNADLANAPALATVSVAFLQSLAPMYAGADLLALGIGLNFAGAAQINVPGIVVPSANAAGIGAQ